MHNLLVRVLPVHEEVVRVYLCFILLHPWCSEHWSIWWSYSSKPQTFLIVYLCLIKTYVDHIVIIIVLKFVTYANF